MSTFEERVTLEILTDSVASALAAQTGGADRLELCANLLEGGTTPSHGMIEAVRARSTLTLHVMIRPRAGDFFYDDHELGVMERDIAVAQALGADGVVLGLLTPEGTVDVPNTSRLIEAARPLRATFHRAFDLTRDPFEALEDVVATGADLLLTSGQEDSALDGAPVIAQLVEAAGDRVVVMPGAGITERNLHRVHELTAARQFHLDARAQRPSEMRYRNERCFMGGALRPSDDALSIVDARRITAFREAAGP